MESGRAVVWELEDLKSLSTLPLVSMGASVSLWTFLDFAI